MNAIEAGAYDVRRTSRKWGYRQLQPIGPELFEKRLSGAMLELILQISQPEWTKSPDGISTIMTPAAGFPSFFANPSTATEPAANVAAAAEKTSAQLETDTSQTHVDIDKSFIAKAPAPVASRAMEQLIT